jgi:STE24 endopeptidase
MNAFLCRSYCAILMIVLALGISQTTTLLAQKPPTPTAAIIPHPALGPIPAAAQFDPAGHLDPERATRAYLDTVPLDRRQASDKYFVGGYWLTLWDALYAIAVLLFLLYSGISARLRDFAAARTSRPWLQTAWYFVPFLLLFTLLEAPLTWYEGFYREHLYRISHQSLGGWLHDQLIGLLIGLILGSILVTILYAVARRLADTWHLWGAAVVCLFSVILATIAPVYLAPLFNTYSRIQDPAVVTPLLRMARANSIPVDAIYQVDASKQSTRVSANVSGLFNTTRITLNDNLLRTCSLEEIEETTGHEMGHYVLNHIYKGLLESFIVIFLIFAILRRWLESMQRRHADQWRTQSIFDPALLPAVILIVTVLSLLLTPLTNTGTRVMEREADLFGLNAARQPDATAEVDLKLAQYRKLNPTPLEEIIFFDHPSGHTRILDAMRWKSQNQGTPGY